MSIWTKTDENPPVDTSLIVRRWSNGNVWAGPHEASPKNQGFAEYIDVPVLEQRLAEKDRLLDQIAQVVAEAESTSPTIAMLQRLLASR